MLQKEAAEPALPTRQMIAPLTSIRAIAAFWVFCYHNKHLKGVPQTFAKFGEQGVVVFYVLSGFLMVYCYNHCSFTRVKCFFDYWIRRIARIYPSTIVCLLMFIYPINNKTYTDQPHFWPLVSNFLMLNCLTICPLGFHLSIYGITWSVSMEFIFYILFPFLALVCRLVVALTKIRYVKHIAGLFMWYVFPVACTAAMYYIVQYLRAAGYKVDIHCYLYFTPVVRVFQFILGIWAGYFYIHQLSPLIESVSTQYHYAMGVVVDFMLVSITSATIYIISFDIQYYGLGINGIAYVFLILLLCVNKGLICFLLSLRPFVHLGEVSFQFYLAHGLTMYWFDEFGIGPGTDWKYPYMFMSTLAMAEIMHFCFENPVYRLILFLVNIMHPNLKCDCKQRSTQASITNDIGYSKITSNGGDDAYSSINSSGTSHVYSIADDTDIEGSDVELVGSRLL